MNTDEKIKLTADVKATRRARELSGVSRKDLGSKLQKSCKTIEKIENGRLRRSYQRRITRECKVLKSMRRIKGYSQDYASLLCGYSRPTIGHIENGRIELDKARIEHILKCYGANILEFETNLKKGELRDEIIEYCHIKIESLDDVKLDVVRTYLGVYDMKLQLLLRVYVVWLVYKSYYWIFG